MRGRIHVTTAPASSPTATPPTDTATNCQAAVGSENAPVTAAATAKRYATSAIASFTRLSPSRIVTNRRGTRSLFSTLVAAIASGGETIAPSTNASGQFIPGINIRATVATTTVVNSVRPTDSSPIGRRLA